MTTEDLGRDLDISHNVLNYLNASFQGYFASLNVLSQLGYQAFNPDEVEKCQKNIEFVEKLLGQLAQGIPVFSMVWKIPQTADAKEALSKVAQLKSLLQHTANHIEKLLIDTELLEDQENMKYLISSYSWFAYTNENYIKGYVEFGKNFTIPEIVSSYEALLPQAEQNLKAAHLFFDIYSGEEEIPQVFFKSIFEESLFLPGMFRTNIHDLNKFLALYKQPFSFEQTDIPPAEAEEWRVINVDPTLAGYWHAFGYTANDMVDWMQNGITVPRQAWFWSCLQFDPQTSRDWIQFGFAPPLAREWANAGFTAEEAVDHIKHGLTNPITAREDSKKIILE